MKDEYFTPTANLLAFDYANVVSASFGTPAVPNEKKKCDIPMPKNKKCNGGTDPIDPIVNPKNKKCN